jgi:hypothetical protein
MFAEEVPRSKAVLEGPTLSSVPDNLVEPSKVPAIGVEATVLRKQRPAEEKTLESNEEKEPDGMPVPGKRPSPD